MIDKSMSPAVRRAYERERLAKQNVPLPVYRNNSVIPEITCTDSDPEWALTIYEELHRNLTPARPAKISPEHCPYPDELCRGCAAACG